jgi:hypothetical protein
MVEWRSAVPCPPLPARTLADRCGTRPPSRGRRGTRGEATIVLVHGYLAISGDGRSYTVGARSTLAT